MAITAAGGRHGHARLGANQSEPDGRHPCAEPNQTVGVTPTSNSLEILVVKTTRFPGRPANAAEPASARE